MKSKREYLIQLVGEIDDKGIDSLFNIIMKRIGSDGKLIKGETKVLCTTKNGTPYCTSDVVDMSEPDFIKLVDECNLEPERIILALNRIYNKKYPNSEMKNIWAIKRKFPITLETMDAFGNIRYVNICEKVCMNG